MSMNIRRIVAYIIDIFIVSIIAGAISVSPLNPDAEKVENYRLELEEINQTYIEQVAELDESDEELLTELIEPYRKTVKRYNYDIARNSVYEQMISIVCITLYYVVFVYFFDSQTIGKRLMKLRIKTVDDAAPSLHTLFLRTLLLFRIPINILTIILCFVLDVDAFYDTSAVLTIITMAYSISLILMALGRQDHRGIHDLISKTKIEMITKREE